MSRSCAFSSRHDLHYNLIYQLPLVLWFPAHGTSRANERVHRQRGGIGKGEGRPESGGRLSQLLAEAAGR